MAAFPFTTAQFLDVFSRYNLAIVPLQWIFLLLALSAIVLTIKKPAVSDRIIFAILGFLWLWMGIVYHILFFATVNPIANLFGLAFVAEGILLIWYGGVKQVTGFRAMPDRYSVTGFIFIAYALVIYPVLGTISGHAYPHLPTFGVPCPTTIFTFGMFLFADRKCPLYLLVIPLLWAFVGAVAALSLGVPEDFGLVLAGVLGTILVLMKNRQWSLQ